MAITHAQRRDIEQSLEAARDKIEEALTTLEEVYTVGIDDGDADGDELNDVTRSAVVGLHNLYTAVKDLREAGADIAEAPVEDGALVTCLVNATLIHEDMKLDIAHLESIIARVKS